MDTGSATPIRIGPTGSQRRASPAATIFFATQRAAYAAERSTLVGSMPENRAAAVPADAAVGIDDDLPSGQAGVSCGPPMTKRPVGLI